jgi:hypothetical protein
MMSGIFNRFKCPSVDIRKVLQLFGITHKYNASPNGRDNVAAIGFGLMGLSAYYVPIENDEERFKVLGFC